DIMFEDGNYYVGDSFIATSEATVQVLNYLNNDEVYKKFRIRIASTSTFPEDKLEKIEVVINKNKKMDFDEPNDLFFSVREIGHGATNFLITVYYESGLTDSTEVRLLLK
ncbi:MAG: hypothetical protein GX661_03185, partial [Acholeplasmataceae bacterium]|nr:hypothetical protein [Acholeplasmataceae bacterium]